MISYLVKLALYLWDVFQLGHVLGLTCGAQVILPLRFLPGRGHETPLTNSDILT